MMRGVFSLVWLFFRRCGDMVSIHVDWQQSKCMVSEFVKGLLGLPDFGLSCEVMYSVFK